MVTTTLPVDAEASGAKSTVFWEGERSKSGGLLARFMDEEAMLAESLWLSPRFSTSGLKEVIGVRVPLELCAPGERVSPSSFLAPCSLSSGVPKSAMEVES